MAKKTAKGAKKTGKKEKKTGKQTVVQLVIPTKKEGCQARATKSLTLVIPTRKEGCYLGFEDS